MVALRRTLPTVPSNSPAGKCVAGERHGRAGHDPADIGFVHRHPDLHLRQVLGDQKQARCIETGHHGLADVHAPVNDDAFDRRLDGAEIQISLRLVEHRLGLHLRDLAGRGRIATDVGLGDFVIRLVGIVSPTCGISLVWYSSCARFQSASAWTSLAFICSRLAAALFAACHVPPAPWPPRDRRHKPSRQFLRASCLPPRPSRNQSSCRPCPCRRK